MDELPPARDGRDARPCDLRAGFASFLAVRGQVDIEGKLRTRKWADKDGVDHYTTEIVGSSLLMLGGKRKEGAPEAEPKGQDEGGYVDDDIPF
jgi:single-strand DNA-binding protein